MKRRNVVAAAVCVILGAFAYRGCTSDAWTLHRLQWAAKFEDQSLRQFATELKDTEQGVRIAINDITIRGGGTHFESTWMLQHSQLPGLDDRLQKVANEPNEPASKRMAINYVLYRRTKETRHLENWFVLVKDPGTYHDIKHGRHFLSLFFVDDALFVKLNTDASHTLPITQEEFRAALRDPTRFTPDVVK